MKPGKTPRDYARGLDFHLSNAVESARLIEVRGDVAADARDLAKRIRQGAQAQRGLTNELQEALRGRST